MCEREIKERIAEKILLLEQLSASEYISNIDRVVQAMSQSLQAGGKLLLAGNGGSAADAQHFAGEIVGRFMKERPGAAAVSLCCDPSVMTSIANDYGYHSVFARQIEGLGGKNDVFIAISTSGNSKNLVEAVRLAKSRGIFSVGLLGGDGGELRDLCDISLVVPSDKTPRIQEIHTFTIHLLCEGIENTLF